MAVICLHIFLNVLDRSMMISWLFAIGYNKKKSQVETNKKVNWYW